MIADVARKPLQNSRQLVERTALQGGGCVIPFPAPLPVDAFELVLHVKQPEPGGTRHGDDNELNQQIRLDPKDQTQARGQPQNGQIHPMHRMPFPRTCGGGWKSLLDQHDQDRGNHKQHHRIARQSIREPLAAG